MRERLKARFPLRELWMTKQKVDPKGVLGNAMIDPKDIGAWLPEHGGGADVVVVGLQEST